MPSILPTWTDLSPDQRGGVIVETRRRMRDLHDELERAVTGLGRDREQVARLLRAYAAAVAELEGSEGT